MFQIRFLHFAVVVMWACRYLVDSLGKKPGLIRRDSIHPPLDKAALDTYVEI